MVMQSTILKQIVPVSQTTISFKINHRGDIKTHPLYVKVSNQIVFIAQRDIQIKTSNSNLCKHIDLHD